MEPMLTQLLGQQFFANKSTDNSTSVQHLYCYKVLWRLRRDRLCSPNLKTLPGPLDTEHFFFKFHDQKQLLVMIYFYYLFCCIRPTLKNNFI